MALESTSFPFYGGCRKDKEQRCRHATPKQRANLVLEGVMKEAVLYKKLKGKQVACLLCAQHCIIEPGDRGLCGIRENVDGTLISLLYGRVIAQHVDPIEKKPLFHFLPGSKSYSIATAGCNFRCIFCQNSDISQGPRERGLIVGREVDPEAIVEDAKATGCQSISYTYTEPTIFFEYALDTARIAQADNIKNVFVSNGYMTEKALETVAPYLDAANVDLKAFTNRFYEEQCGARLSPVLKTLRGMKERGIWLEVTTLLIPGLNDDPGEVKEMAEFLVSLGPEIPWHLSRFYPRYKMVDRAPTSLETIQKARQIGLEAGLKYVYTGNIPGDEGESTFCRRCGELVIGRIGFSIVKNALREGRCPKCETRVDGVGM